MADLAKATLFFKEVFSAKEVYASKGNNYSLSTEKFFLINEVWIAIMEGESLHEKTYNHIAFKVSQAELREKELIIKNLGLEIKDARPRIQGEAESLYFYDFDNHLFELHTGTLKERLASYLK